MKRKQSKFVIIDPRGCVACWKCVGECPKKAIGKVSVLCHRHVVFAHPEACVGCGKCVKTCPNGVFQKVGSEAPIRRHYALERIMPLALTAVAVTGVGLHMAYDGVIDVSSWHGWAVAHVVTAAVCLPSVALHVVRHRRGFRKALSLAVVIAFIAAAITGIASFGGGRVGLWHFDIGILMTALAVVHKSVANRRK